MNGSGLLGPFFFVQFLGPASEKALSEIVKFGDEVKIYETSRVYWGFVYVGVGVNERERSNYVKLISRKKRIAARCASPSRQQQRCVSFGLLVLVVLVLIVTARSGWDCYYG